MEEKEKEGERKKEKGKDLLIKHVTAFGLDPIHCVLAKDWAILQVENNCERREREEGEKEMEQNQREKKKGRRMRRQMTIRLRLRGRYTRRRKGWKRRRRKRRRRWRRKRKKRRRRRRMWKDYISSPIASILLRRSLKGNGLKEVIPLPWQASERKPPVQLRKRKEE